MAWRGCLFVNAVVFMAMLSSSSAQNIADANTSSAPNAMQPVQTATAASVPTPSSTKIPSSYSSPGSCETEIAGARLGTVSNLNVQLDPSTLWRPRGAAVKFIISSASGTPPQVKRVFACFRWELAEFINTIPKVGGPGYMPSPLVMNVPNTDGLVEYSAIVPGLMPATRDTGSREVGAVQYTAVNTVPLADMQILIELDNGEWLAVILPVGVTSAWCALLVLASFMLIACIALWWLAPKTLLGGASGFNFRNISRHTLAIISTGDGIASLSQFQVMLWTVVVAGSAIYVMVLSGNLISISSGTLTLLGIAGGTLILAKIGPGNSSNDVKPVSPNPPISSVGPASTQKTALLPYWSQLLLKGDASPEIDVTRVQMLVFTLITAAFVSIKVAASYSIPEIPDNFLVLMGISNGVYLAGRQN